MCDYSLHHVASRPAHVGEVLVTTGFPGTHTRGFTSPSEPNVAVCLLPGTEVAFEENAKRDEFLIFKRSLREKVARFRQVHLDMPYSHHDALEFASGRVVLLTELSPGQRATVLQLPSAGVRVELEETADRGIPVVETVAPRAAAAGRRAAAV